MRVQLHEHRKARTGGAGGGTQPVMVWDELLRERKVRFPRSRATSLERNWLRERKSAKESVCPGLLRTCGMPRRTETGTDGQC